MPEWLQTNKNRRKIIVLQKQRKNLLIKATSGTTNKEVVREEIGEINSQIEKLAINGGYQCLGL